VVVWGMTYHFVHEVLNTIFVQNTVRVDEENEKIVVAFQVLGVDLIDQLECRFLAVSLPTVGEPRDRNSGLSISDINTFGVARQCQGYSKLFNRLEVQFVFLVTVKREKDMNT